MKTRLNIALILSGAILFFAISITQAQSSTVKPERGLEVKTQNAGSAQFLKVTSNNNIVSYDFTMNAQEDMSINENNVGSRIYIKRGGNIGINNNNPQESLDVNGNIRINGNGNIEGTLRTTDQIRIDNPTGIFSSRGILEIVADDNSSGGEPMIFKVGDLGVSGEKMRILNNGNVGIGTNNPLAKLSISDGNIPLEIRPGEFFDGTQFVTRPRTASFDIPNIGKISFSDTVVFTQPNVGIGTASPEATLDVNGDSKFVGRMELINAPGKLSIFIGKNAGINNDVNAGDNIFIGAESGLFNDTGSFSTFLGTLSGRNNTTGNWNTFLGRSAGFGNTTGSDNTFVGKFAGLENTVGSRNTFLGTSAGLIAVGDSTAESIAIGYNAKVQCSNCAVIGGTGDDAVKVGIGLTIPEAELDVNGTARIRNLPSGSGSTVVADIDGNLFVTSSSPNINEQRINDLEEENAVLKARLEKVEQLMQALVVHPNTATSTKVNVTDATLQQNAPNPFTEATNISYFIPEHIKSASLQVIDQNGRIIKRIPIQGTGNGQITLQANLLSAGTYSYSLILDGRVMETKQMVLTH